MTIRRRLLWGILAVAAVTLAAGAIVGVAIQREVREAAERELFRQGEVTAELVEQELDQRPLRNRGDVARVLASARAFGGHDYVDAAMLGPGGRLVPLGEGGALISNLPTGVADRGIVELEVNGEPVMATVRRVEVGRTPREMVIAIGRIDDLGFVSVVTTTVLVALAAGAIVALLLAIWLSRSLGNRLDAISGAARSYAAGDFDTRVPEMGDDELAAVGRAFNDMAADLEAARRRERDFLMSVGHDLRTPLTTIRGYAEGLDTGAVPEEDVARVAGVIHLQTSRLSRLIEDLMLLARIEAREFTLRPEQVDLAAHIKETLDGARLRADDARVSIEVDLEPIGLFVVDPDRVAQVVTNLLDNALRYTPEGGTVLVTLEAVEGTARVTVADNGPGIEVEDVAHVFERLYVAQRYRPVRPEGSGLGLSIIKELVDTMGGTVAVTSHPGRGTSVAVTLVPLDLGGHKPA